MKYLHLLNKYLLQLFFIRATIHSQTIITDMDFFECSLLMDGSFGLGGTVKASHVEQWYSIQYWVIPFTGWSNDFKYFGKNANYLRITKNKKIINQTAGY